MNERLLTFLVNKGLLTTEQADKLRAEYERTGRSVRELLAEGGYVNEEQVTDALAAVYRMPVVRLYEQHIPVEVRTVVRADLLREHVVLPFGFDENERIMTLIITDNGVPFNPLERDEPDISLSAAKREIPTMA